MASSGGTELLLPEGVSPAAARKLLVARYRIRPGAVESVDRRFFDTFDGRLHSAGLRVFAEDARLVVHDGARELGRAEISRNGRRPGLLAGDLPPGALRDLLGPMIEMRALAPVARVRSRLQPLRVLDDEAKTVVRLVLEEPRLVGEDREVRLPSRLHVDAVRGYDGAHERTVRSLEAELGFALAEQSLLDAAVAASGGSPAGVSSKLDVDLRPDDRADAAAAALCLHLSRTISVNLPGTLADVDTEFLHDLRVAVRRTRSAQRQLRSVFPPEPLAHFRAEFRWVQQATGPTRDLDVFLLGLDELCAPLTDVQRADLAPLRRLLAERRRREQRRMVRMLRSARFETLLESWTALLAGLPDSAPDDRPDAVHPIAAVAGVRIGRTYRRMVKMGEQIDDESPAETLHELRKLGKELRYLLEFFAALYPAEVVRPLVRDLKALQDTLGRFYDREVQAETLRGLVGDVAARDGGPAAAMGMGLLVFHLERDQADARSEFLERFAAFAGKGRRALVRETFA